MSGSIYGGIVAGTPNLRAGAASCVINGEAVDFTNLKYNLNTLKRETKRTQNAIAGFGEMPQESVISMTILDAGSLSVAAFNLMRNVPIQVPLANGKTIYGEGMWTTEVGDVNTETGEFDVTFHGRHVTEA